MGTSHQSIRTPVLPRISELLLPLHQRIYSAKAAPLIGVLKKNRAWHWSEEYQHAFKELKKAISEEPILVVPDHTNPFEVQTDAFDFAIDGVFMQESHPIAFES